MNIKRWHIIVISYWGGGGGKQTKEVGFYEGHLPYNDISISIVITSWEHAKLIYCSGKVSQRTHYSGTYIANQGYFFEKRCFYKIRPLEISNICDS